MENKREFPLPSVSVLLVPLIIGTAIIVVALAGTYHFAKSQDAQKKRRMTARARDAIKECLGYLRKGEYNRAEASAVSAVELAPDMATAHLFLGEARAGLSGMEKMKLALENYSHCLEIEPDEPLAYYGRGQVNFRLGKTEAALADFTEAIRLKPGYAAAYMARSMANKRLGNDKQAAEDRKRAMELDLSPADINVGVSGSTATTAQVAK